MWNRTDALIRAVQGKKDSRIILVILTDADGRTIDLSGASARLYIRKPVKTVAFLTGEMENVEEGVCSFTLSSGVTEVPGIACTQILIFWPDNRILKVGGPSLEILPSALENAVEFFRAGRGFKQS